MISKQQGATLLEVLIAASLIAFGVMGIIRLQVYMEQKVNYAHQSTQALHIAESRLERLSVALYGYDGSVDDFNAEEQIKGVYQLTVFVTELPDAINDTVQTLYVSVEVSWMDSKSESKNIKLITVMTNT